MHELKPHHYLQQLQPLRIPAGWTIGWNTFHAIPIPADGFSGSSLLYLLRHDRRLVIDVEWRPEFDPNGHYNYYVQRQPLRTDEPADNDDEILASAQSRSREDVVAWLDTWLARSLVEAPPSDAEPTALERLHPLHLSSGWTIHRNAITAQPPSPSTPPPPESLLLFRAIADQRRFRLDVLRQAETDGNVSYLIELLYAPYHRTERGRRREDVPLTFDGEVRVMHRFVTTAYDELVRYLEAWLWRAAGWAVEGH